MARPKTIVVTGADARYFALLRDMIDSTATARRTRGFSCAVLDYGLLPDQLAWLNDRVDVVVRPQWRFALSAPLRTPENLIFVSRLYLREELPAYDVYLWFDADAWLQRDTALDDYVDGALAEGLAIATESHRAYRPQAWLTAWTAKHFILGYGLMRGAQLLARRHLNAGVFALRHDAPHWERWRERLAAAIAASGRVAPHDQFSLNQVVWQDRLPARLMPPTCNWICDRGPPRWNASAQSFCVPDSDQEPIGIMHLAGPAKHMRYDIDVSGGGIVATALTFQAAQRMIEKVSPAAV